MTGPEGPGRHGHLDDHDGLDDHDDVDDHDQDDRDGDQDGRRDGDREQRIGPGLDDPRVQAGIDHLQRAAREVIAASRALLDVAEELVEDPRAVGSLADVLASVGDLAARATRSGPGDAHRRGAGGRQPAADGDDDPPVQRIPIS